MTLNQLIEYINDCSGSHSEQLPVNAAKRIIAALHRLERLEKAGQAMRDNLFDATKEWKLDEALKAWDKATKEDI